MPNNPLSGDFSSPGFLQDDLDGGIKRKASEEAGGPPGQQRAKRNRYISIACNECKRRKIKCNGSTPCQRCGNLNLECVYAPNCCSSFKESQEYKDMTAHIAALQDQVNALYNELNHVRAHLASSGPFPQLHHSQIDPSLQRSSHPGPSASPGAAMVGMSPPGQRAKSHSHSAAQPTFRGPTSNDFNLGVAKSSLQTMGITSLPDGEGDLSGGAGSGTRDVSPVVASPTSSQQPGHPFHTDKDPIWMVTKEEALRLCDSYEDEMGVMYPVLDISKIKAYAEKLYRFMDAASRTGLMERSFPGADALDDEDTSILKLVLATGMVTETAGRNELGRKMFERVKYFIDNLLLESGTVKGIQMLALAAMYEFHRDRESTSWRLIGIAARLCMELGLHRRETYEAMQDPSERHQTILLFWSIYVLDRRWAFGTGMPYALRESDIDQLCPKPEGRSPYLSAMIEFSGIGSKVWQSVVSTSASGSAPVNVEEMEYLDYQLIQWQKNVPPHLYFDPSRLGQHDDRTADRSQTRAGRRLPLILYLRRNQMRMAIYRPVLHTATSIMQHKKQAYSVVDIARDTIRLLTHIKSTSDLYDRQQMLFNAFLTSALAVLFLAVAHTPALFAETVKEEYYMGLDLVRNFSKDSYVGKRLWKTVRVLIEVAPKLGLPSRDRERKDARPGSQPVKGELDLANRSAALAMAGLAGHNVDEVAMFQGTWGAGETETTGSSGSPDALANNLSSLFEAAGGYQQAGNGNTSQDLGAAGFGVPVDDWSQEDLSEILKGLF